jgi:hypothetical protein
MCGQNQKERVDECIIRTRYVSAETVSSPVLGCNIASKFASRQWKLLDVIFQSMCLLSFGDLLIPSVLLVQLFREQC